MSWLFGKKDDDGLPKKGESFEDYIDKQGFKHFKGAELARYFQRPKNTYPPRLLWPNFLPTLRIVDDLRQHLGKPIRITSSYRSPEYNASVGGAPKSQHKEFRAADIQCDGASPQEVYKVLHLWREQGRFSGGLGLYSTFVHVDTRGHNTDW